MFVTKCAFQTNALHRLNQESSHGFMYGNPEKSRIISWESCSEPQEIISSLLGNFSTDKQTQHWLFVKWISYHQHRDITFSIVIVASFQRLFWKQNVKSSVKLKTKFASLIQMNALDCVPLKVSRSMKPDEVLQIILFLISICLWLSSAKLNMASNGSFHTFSPLTFDWMTVLFQTAFHEQIKMIVINFTI